MIRCWHLVCILIRTDYPCLGVGCHSEGSEGCDNIVELRGSNFVPHRSEDRLEIEMLKESLWQQDEETQWRDEV
jgi:hypothetical protein